MNNPVRWFGGAVLVGLLVLGGSAQAVPFLAPSINPVLPPQPINPNFMVAPGLTLNQAAYNTAVIGRAISHIPPYVYGYNPYPSPVVNTAPVIGGGVPYISPVMPALGYPSSTLSTYPGLTGPGGYPSSATLATNPIGYDPAASAGYPNSYSGSYYGEDPLAGFLRGSADVISASGNFYKSVQSARLIQTQADEGRIDYRRRLIDEARYERMNMLTTEELRQQQLAKDLARTRHEPPIAEIASGKSLNDLLRHLMNDPTGQKGPNVPIDPEVLKRINVTDPMQPNTSVGLLKDEGKLQWPQALASKEFDAPRKHLSATMEDVVQGLKFSNPAERGKIEDLKTDFNQLKKSVEKSELSPTDYIAARDYLDQVDAAIRALQDPNVLNYFNHKFSAKNVAELVDDMKGKGLDFAPAAPGDAGAYRALHQALVSYDYGLPQQASTPPTPPMPPKQP